MAIKKGVYIINGVEKALYSDYEKDTLATVLRRNGYTGLKIGCGTGQCGVCTVLVDGAPVRACIKKMKNVPEYCKIETIEGIGLASNLHPLQRAWIKYGGVQCGFCTPGFIMSAKALLDKNPNVTRQDVRDWFTKNNNLCRCTGYKPLVDAVMAAAEVMSGRKPIEWLDPEIPEGDSIYGTHYPRPAALGKVMGATDYGDDIGMKMPPDTLELAVKLPDWSHARVLSVDISEAEKMPGVVGIMTAEDVKGSNNMGSPLALARSEAKFDNIYVLHGTGMKIRRTGDAIAIVAARTREEARAAAAKIKVEYEKLPVYDNLLESCVPGAIQVSEDYSNIFAYQPLIRGEDTAPVFEQAETDPNIHVVEGSFYSPRQAHLSLEPDAAQSFYDEEGVLTIVYRSQHVSYPLGAIPQVLGMDEKCRIIESPTGASFGAAVRFDTGMYAAIAAYCLKRPVTLTLSYAEKQLITGKRTCSYGNYKAAVSSDGEILACDYDIAQEAGGYVGSAINNLFKGCRYVLGHYRVPRYRGLHRAGIANNAYHTAYRGAGCPEIYTGSEQIADMLAYACGMDPYEFRYKNVVREGDLTPNGYPFKVYPLVDMMDQFRPVWQAALKWKSEPAEEGWKRGVGVDIGGYCVSTPMDTAEVALELMPDGTITHYNSWEDQGQGADIGTLVETVEALKPLGIKPTQVKLVMNDTRMCPITGLAGASRSHYFAGRATIDAANQLMDAMRKPDGTYRTYDEMKAEGIPTWYKGVYNLIGEGHSQVGPDDGTGDPQPDQNFIINIARVEVEEATGKTRVVAINSLADVGVVGNYLALDGQAYGGIFHSLGFALSESYSDFDKKYLTPLGCGFPKCNDVPDDFTIEYHQTPRKKGPFGSGGASECFQSACHVCLLNAIYSAVGVRCYHMPATPEKIKAAMDAIKEGRDYAPDPYYIGEPYQDVLADIIAHPVAGKTAAPTGGITLD